jgi:nitrite reductase (NADH) small subunit
MACQILIGNVDQIPKGEGRTFEVNGLQIAVFRICSGEAFATQPDCPHRGGPLETASSAGRPSFVPFTTARLICGQERI